MSVTDGGTQYPSALATEKKIHLSSICAFAIITITKHKCTEIELFTLRPYISIR